LYVRRYLYLVCRQPSQSTGNPEHGSPIRSVGRYYKVYQDRALLRYSLDRPTTPSSRGGKVSFPVSEFISQSRMINSDQKLLNLTSTLGVLVGSGQWHDWQRSVRSCIGLNLVIITHPLSTSGWQEKKRRPRHNPGRRFSLSSQLTASHGGKISSASEQQSLEPLPRVRGQAISKCHTHLPYE